MVNKGWYISRIGGGHFGCAPWAAQVLKGADLWHPLHTQERVRLVCAEGRPALLCGLELLLGSSSNRRFGKSLSALEFVTLRCVDAKLFPSLP
jgi:hypothetical protein